jgi:hypothetical protein
VYGSKLIDVIVISTPGSKRAVPLLETLEKSNLFEIHVLEATMYSAQNDKRAIDRTGQLAVYGHELPDGLIGCAISHQTAYELMAKLGNPAVVLEDDARIPSLNNFEKMVGGFFSSHLGESAVLSLLPWNHKQPCSGMTATTIRFMRLIGRTPLTVGYALTLNAAIELSHANPTLKYAPDWPPSQVAYFSSIVGVISHGDLQSGSTIQHVKRDLRTNRVKRLIKTVLVDFWRYRKEFSSLKEYVQVKVLPSFTWRIDDFRGTRRLRKLAR